MTNDEMEALSRRYGNDVVILLRLSSGNFAVFNNARELCGIAEAFGEWPPACWREPVSPKRQAPQPDVDLKELGLA